MSCLKELKDVPTLLGQGGASVKRNALDGKVIAFYFSAHWCPPCRSFTPQLASWYKNFKATSARADEFEIVFVSSDRDEAAFAEYFAEMPWLALPFEHRDVKNKLSSKFKVRGIPTMVVVDAEGELLTKNGRGIVSNDPSGAGFPWAPKSVNELLGDTLAVPGGGTVAKTDALAGKHVGLYFSAHWCGPCRGFTPQLAKTYDALKAAGKPFEIVFVSADRDEEAFAEYHASMPWLALPFARREAKAALNEHFEVEGIPSLVVLDPAGKVVNGDARAAVGADPDGAEFPWAPKPLNELTQGSVSSLNEQPTLIAFTGGDEAAVAAARATLQPLAEAEAAAAEDSGDTQLFFMYTADSDAIDLVRDFLKLGDASPLLVICDIPGEAKYIAEDAALTTENIAAFAADYKAGKLQGKKLRA